MLKEVILLYYIIVVSALISVILKLNLRYRTYSMTRRNMYKLQKFTRHYNLRKYSFCSRVVNIWNSLPNEVVEVDTINNFKESSW